MVSVLKKIPIRKAVRERLMRGCSGVFYDGAVCHGVFYIILPRLFCRAY